MKKLLKRIIDSIAPKRWDIPTGDITINDGPIQSPTRPPIHIKPEIVKPFDIEPVKPVDIEIGKPVDHPPVKPIIPDIEPPKPVKPPVVEK